MYVERLLNLEVTNLKTFKLYYLNIVFMIQKLSEGMQSSSKNGTAALSIVTASIKCIF
mgnify:CR=1 FL=1